jgi:hypothetical protein
VTRIRSNPNKSTASSGEAKSSMQPKKPPRVLPRARFIVISAALPLKPIFPWQILFEAAF